MQKFLKKFRKALWTALTNFFRMNWLRAVGLILFSRRLNRSGPSLTFSRLCTSRHVDDLQSIALAALGGIALALYYGHYIWVQWKDLHDQIVIVAGLAASAATALGWAYQAGGRRLGAVDLFASEISAICRVCLIVDYAKVSIERAEAPAKPADTPKLAIDSADRQAVAAAAPADDARFGKFTSAEHYTPVYDNHISDLQPLDFDVVTEVTRFYTYRKTMMDFLRRIASTPPGDDRKTLMVQMIYMQFLMYESARKATIKLIEFEPSQSDCVVGILCSELVLYGYLRQQYRSGFQADQLRLRQPTYEKICDALLAELGNPEHDKLVNRQNWEAACAMKDELKKRYEAMQDAIAGTGAASPQTMANAVSPISVGGIGQLVTNSPILIPPTSMPVAVLSKVASVTAGQPPSAQPSPDLH